MKFLDYINGQRKGKNAHRLERESMSDPFLLDAIEGFDNISDNHLARIATIQDKISKSHSTTKTRRVGLWSSVAATIAILIIGTAGLLFLKNMDTNNYAQADEQLPIDLYLPDNIYEENIAIIAIVNTQLTRDISVKVANSNNDKFDSKEEKLEEIGTIDLFIPPNGHGS